MARRAGLNDEVILAAAIDLANRDGHDDLSISRLADELGVRAPSLYHHIDGLDAVRRSLKVEAHRRLKELSEVARQGLRGADALRAQCHAYREFSHEQPGLYVALISATPKEDDELWSSMLTTIEPVVASMMELGLEDDAIFEALRLFRAATHGFLLLEMTTGYGFDLDVDTSYERLVNVLITGLRAELT